MPNLFQHLLTVKTTEQVQGDESVKIYAKIVKLLTYKLKLSGRT